MTTVFFVRHGQTENPHNILRLRTPGLHLTTKGQTEARETADRLAGESIDRIFSSPIERCWETAEIIGSVVGKQVTVDDRLIEVGSPYQGILLEKYDRMLHGKSLYADSRQLQEGESDKEIIMRMRSFLDRVLKEYEGETVAAVSHGDPMTLLEYNLMGKDYGEILVNATPNYIPLAGFFEFKFEGKRLVEEKKSWV